MFARVATYELPAHRLDDAVRNFQGAIREVEAIQGFTEACVLVSAEENRALTMTLWASEHAMAQSRVTASRLRSEAATASDGGVLSVQE